MGKSYYLSSDEPLQFTIVTEDGSEEIVSPLDHTCSEGHTIKYLEIDGVKEQVQCQYGEGKDYCEVCLEFFV